MADEKIRQCFEALYQSTPDTHDAVTVDPNFPRANARYHYIGIEKRIIEYLYKHKFQPNTLLDVGTGFGHWVQFYNEVYQARYVVACDISTTAILGLRGEGKNCFPIVGDVFSPALSKWRFDLINGIGVFHHIIDESEWRQTLLRCYDLLKRGGLLIASGPMRETGDIQTYPKPPKRARQYRYWRKTLLDAGFNTIDFVFQDTKNQHKIHVPQSDLVFAWKGKQ